MRNRLTQAFVLFFFWSSFFGVSGAGSKSVALPTAATAAVGVLVGQCLRLHRAESKACAAFLEGRDKTSGRLYAHARSRSKKWKRALIAAVGGTAAAWLWYLAGEGAGGRKRQASGGCAQSPVTLVLPLKEREESDSALLGRLVREINLHDRRFHVSSGGSFGPNVDQGVAEKRQRDFEQVCSLQGSTSDRAVSSECKEFARITRPGFSANFAKRSVVLQWAVKADGRTPRILDITEADLEMYLADCELLHKYNRPSWGAEIGMCRSIGNVGVLYEAYAPRCISLLEWLVSHPEASGSLLGDSPFIEIGRIGAAHPALARFCFEKVKSVRSARGLQALALIGKWSDDAELVAQCYAELKAWPYNSEWPEDVASGILLPWASALTAVAPKNAAWIRETIDELVLRMREGFISDEVRASVSARVVLAEIVSLARGDAGLEAHVLHYLGEEVQAPVRLQRGGYVPSRVRGFDALALLVVGSCNDVTIDECKRIVQEANTLNKEEVLARAGCFAAIGAAHARYTAEAYQYIDEQLAEFPTDRRATDRLLAFLSLVVESKAGLASRKRSEMTSKLLASVLQCASVRQTNGKDAHDGVKSTLQFSRIERNAFFLALYFNRDLATDISKIDTHDEGVQVLQLALSDRDGVAAAIRTALLRDPIGFMDLASGLVDLFPEHFNLVFGEVERRAAEGSFGWFSGRFFSRALKQPHLRPEACLPVMFNIMKRAAAVRSCLSMGNAVDAVVACMRKIIKTSPVGMEESKAMLSMLDFMTTMRKDLISSKIHLVTIPRLRHALADGALVVGPLAKQKGLPADGGVYERIMSFLHR